MRLLLRNQDRRLRGSLELPSTREEEMREAQARSRCKRSNTKCLVAVWLGVVLLAGCAGTGAGGRLAWPILAAGGLTEYDTEKDEYGPQALGKARGARLKKFKCLSLAQDFGVGAATRLRMIKMPDKR